MGWKYATREDRLEAGRARKKEQYYREKRELTLVTVERPSRQPAELAKRARLRREIAQIRWNNEGAKHGCM